MTTRTRTRLAVLAAAGIALSLAPPAVVTAQDRGKAALHEAYFLEHESNDYAAARKLYEKVLDSSADEGVQQAARSGAARCRDHLAAEDFATLMPADSLFYCELRRPGEIVEKLAGMLGLAGDDMHEALAQRPSVDSKAPFYMPKKIVISPALFNVLGSFGGLAVAITDFNPRRGDPSGVMVLHHGDVDLIKGLLETGFQFAPTAEKIKNLPTFAVTIPGPGPGTITGVLTESLLIAGNKRELVEGVVGRLTGTGASSLGSREDLKEFAAQRAGATLFAYADVQAILKIFKAQMGEGDRREFEIANALADFDSFRWVAFSSGIHEGVMSSQLAVRLADDHHSLAYNLMRMTPMSRKSLACVPADAAAILGFGLNPELTGMAAAAGKARSGDASFTGWDIGREFFGNIQEVSAFVLPGDFVRLEGDLSDVKVPNVGVLLAANNVAKSRALWGQLLSLPSLVNGGEPQAPKTTKIGETEVTVYAIPEFGSVYMAELDGSLAIGLSRNTMKAAIRAQSKGESVLKDEVMGKAIARLPKDSTFMAIAHVGRLAKVAAGSGEPQVAFAAGPVSELCANTIAWAAVGQSPNQMSIQFAVTGLPNINDALKKFGPMINAFAGAAMPTASPQARAVRGEDERGIRE